MPDYVPQPIADATVDSATHNRDLLDSTNLVSAFGEANGDKAGHKSSHSLYIKESRVDVDKRRLDSTRPFDLSKARYV
jgi:hypothetical protein